MDFVVVFLYAGLEFRKSVGGGIVRTMLAAAADYTYSAFAALQCPDNRAGDALFVKSLGFFLLRADIDNGFAFATYIRGARQLRFLQQIDILYMHLGRKLA